jgi:hypothetical protein
MEAVYTVGKKEHGSHYIQLEAAVVQALTQDGNKRVVCTLNRVLDIHSALMKSKDGTAFIHLGLKVCKQLQLKAGSSVSASFKIDTSVHQFEMPEELQAVLDSDPEANDYFLALSPGKRRSLIYLVSQVKSSDKRIERALKFLKG